MILSNPFSVSVSTPLGLRCAKLSLSSLDDLPGDWDFAWKEIGRQTNSNYQAIAKIVLNGECLGLIKFVLYPEPGKFQVMDIELIEANPLSRGKMSDRLAKPVGLWLIWYAIKTGLQYCNPVPKEPFVFLQAYEEAFEYYENVVGMKCLGPIAISPSEDGYAFQFLLEEAKVFCKGIERVYGVAKKQST